MQKKSTREEFKIEKDGLEVVHLPTGARFWSYPYSNPSERRVVGKNEGNLGAILPNGDEYDAGEVEAVAAKLLRGENVA